MTLRGLMSCLRSPRRPCRRHSVVATAIGLLSVLLLGGSARASDVVEYVITDALGNIRAIEDEQGNVIERHDYLAFGEECTTGPCAANPGVGAGQPRKFTGKERDQETGFDYFGARYYGAKIGRFTTVDPVYNWNANLLDPQRWNRYAYGRNNPLRYVDPDGKDIFDYFGGVINAFGSNLVFGAGRASGGNSDFQFGQNVGDTLSVAAAGYEAYVGGGIVAGGGGLTLSVAGSPVGIPAAVGGGVLIGHAAAFGTSGLFHLSKNSADSGSYTVTFDSGKRYHGKGQEGRANDSAKRVSGEHSDTAKKVEWKPAANDKEGFKAEARRIRGDGGVENSGNYNKINSPGEKLLKKQE